MSKHKRTILAIVLSLLVIVGWQYFIGEPQLERQRQEAQLKQQQQQAQTQPSAAQSSAPSVQAQTASREAVIGPSPRIAIDTPRLGGSINLKGGRIDDLTLTQYRETTDPTSPPIVLFSPSGAPHAFYAEFGWLPASHRNAEAAGPDTVWKQRGSGALGVGHPVMLTYDNGQGLVFTRTIAVDDHYLFTVQDEVINNGGSPVTLFPYALISRHGRPQGQSHYIFLEGLIGVVGDQGLQEETYRKIDGKRQHSLRATFGSGSDPCDYNFSDLCCVRRVDIAIVVQTPLRQQSLSFKFFQEGRGMGRKNPKPFTIVTYAEPEPTRAGPPRTAKLVASVTWSWSPANSRSEHYLICTDRKRTAWTLWAMTYDFDEMRMYIRKASGTPVSGYTARFAAEQLLIATWRSELETFDTDLRGGFVEEEGLLTKSDIRRIEQEYIAAAH
jgi:YidC/Oxa1 family membrane protein insertase